MDVVGTIYDGWRAFVYDIAARRSEGSETVAVSTLICITFVPEEESKTLFKWKEDVRLVLGWEAYTDTPFPQFGHYGL